MCIRDRHSSNNLIQYYWRYEIPRITTVPRNSTHILHLRIHTNNFIDIFIRGDILVQRYEYTHTHIMNVQYSDKGHGSCAVVSYTKTAAVVHRSPCTALRFRLCGQKVHNCMLGLGQPRAVTDQKNPHRCTTTMMMVMECRRHCGNSTSCKPQHHLSPRPATSRTTQ